MTPNQRRVLGLLPPAPGNPAGEEQRRGLAWLYFFVAINSEIIEFYLSGAGSDGGAQTDPDASLGGYRSSTKASRVGILYSRAIAGLAVLLASRANGAGGLTGSIQVVDSDTLTYAAPDSSTAGEAVEIANGESKVLSDGDDASKWIRVERTSAGRLQGVGLVEFADQFNNVFGMSNADDAESTAGGDRYRAVFALADRSASSVKFYLDTLGTQATTSAAQLSGAGSGTIQGATDCFIDWPSKGWARIQQSDGTLREIVYYSSRTDTVLTVPSLGRGRLGTSAAAGGATDIAFAVPGIRIGWEAADPVEAGDVQTVANESTAPTGITWSTGITAAGGIDVGALATGEQGALWIHRELPAGVSAIAQFDNRIKCQIVSDGRTYTETLAGLYRIAVDATARYELHIGVDGPPDLSAAPDETFTSLPHTTTAELTAGHEYQLVTNYRNEYDLVSQSQAATTINIDGVGDAISVVPSGPDETAIEAGAAGAFTVTASYFYDLDGDDQADTWLIYLRTDGTDPDPDVDTPVTVTMGKADGAAQLSYTTSTYSAGTTGKVLVRTRRAADTADSTNATIFSATNSTTGPTAPLGGIFYRRVAEQTQ